VGTSGKPLPAPRIDPVERALSSLRRNLDELRVFASEIGQLADRRDKAVMEKCANTLRGIFGNAVTVTNEDPPARGAQDPDHSNGSQGNPVNHDGVGPVPERSGGERLSEILPDPEKRQAFVRAIDAMARRHPGQGAILRRGAVVSLMSHFENLIADLGHAFYSLHPGALPAEERSLTLAELRGLGSVEEAQTYLITQEVDAVLREPLERQIDYFAKRPKVDLSRLKPYRDMMIEVDQRRHLYVHNRGRVNKRYLTRVQPELVKDYGAVEGKPLKSSDTYVEAAIDQAFLLGTLLGQLCWRKWQPASVAEADSDLITAVYDELRAGRFDLVASLAGAVDGLDFAEEQSHRIVLINHAIALKELGRPHDVLALLARADWTACDLRFRVALHVLRDERDAMFPAVRKAVAAEEIKPQELREWPLFRQLRMNDEFRKLYSELFPNERIDVEEVSEDAEP
jgi:hypothetical protein